MPRVQSASLWKRVWRLPVGCRYPGQHLIPGRPLALEAGGGRTENMGSGWLCGIVGEQEMGIICTGGDREDRDRGHQQRPGRHAVWKVGPGRNDDLAVPQASWTKVPPSATDRARALSSAKHRPAHARHRHGPCPDLISSTIPASRLGPDRSLRRAEYPETTVTGHLSTIDAPRRGLNQVI